MLVEWLKAPSVLVLSYQTFSVLTNIQGHASTDARVLEIKSILLERPSIVVLDEGHYARNNLSKVKEQLMAMKTPLRVMLSGSTPYLVSFSKEIDSNKRPCAVQGGALFRLISVLSSTCSKFVCYMFLVFLTVM